MAAAIAFCVATTLSFSASPLAFRTASVGASFDRRPAIMDRGQAMPLLGVSMNARLSAEPVMKGAGADPRVERGGQGPGIVTFIGVIAAVAVALKAFGLSRLVVPFVMARPKIFAVALAVVVGGYVDVLSVYWHRKKTGRFWERWSW